MKSSDLTPTPLSEAARLLAVSERTVRRLVDSGDIHAIRIGATLAVPSNVWPLSACRADEGAALQPLLSQHDVAQALGCPPCKVRALAESGKLRTVMIGRSCRWRREDVIALAQSKGAQ